MTSVEKLLIQGIRSFASTNSSTIVFQTPLTLIVGPNGAGKTTVIECLKYACTGELPPDAKKGQAWIHDTKLAGEREVKAQVRLLFKTATGKPVIAIRSLQLTQKLNKQECKTLDSSLQTQDSTGKKVTQSMKCADLDKEIPELMGVSKAVLQNVIFCHQEESNWPLSDSATLKKKFDDIFAATRYTKALAAIKDQRKTLSSELKELEGKKREAEAKRHSVHAMREELKNFKEQEEQLLERIAEARDMVTKATESHKQSIAAYTSVRTIADAIAQAEAIYKSLEQNCKNLGSTLVTNLSHLSDGELLSMQRELASNADELSKLVLKADSTCKDIASQLQKKNAEHINAQRDLDAFEVTSKKIDTERLRREEGMRQAHERFSIHKRAAFPASLTDETAVSYCTSVNAMIDKIFSKIASSKEEHNKALEVMQQEVSAAQAAAVEAATMVASARSQLQELTASKNKIDAEISQKERLAAGMETINRGFDEEKRLIAEWLKEHNESDIEVAISNLRETLETSRRMATEISRNVASMTEKRTQRAKLDTVTEHFGQMEEKYRRLLDDNTSLLKSTLPNFDRTTPPQQMKTIAESLLREKTATVKALQQALSEKQQKSSSLQGVKKTLSDQLTDLTSSESQSKSKIAAANIGAENVPSKLRSIDAEADIIKTNTAMIQSESIVYNKFIDEAKAESHCPLCKRELDSVEHFVDSLMVHLAEVPTRLKQYDEQIKSMYGVREQLSKLEAVWHDLQRVKGEIPRISEQIRQIDEDSMAIETKISECETDLQVAQAEEKRLHTVVQIINQCISAYTDLEKARVNVDKERSILRHNGSDLIDDDSQTSTVIADAIERLKQKQSDAQKSIDDTTTSIEYLQARKESLSGYEKKILMFKNSHHEIATAKSRSDEIGKAVHDLERRLEEQEIAQNSKRDRVLELEASFNKKKNDFEPRMKKSEEEAKNLRGTFEQFGAANKNIAQLVAELMQMPAAEARVKSLQADVNTISEALKAKQAELEELKARQSGSEKMNVDLNVQYRQARQKMKDQEEVVRAKKREAATANLEQRKVEMNEAQKLLDAQTSKFNQHVGARSSVLAQIEAKTQQISKENKTDVDESWRTTFIQLKTCEMALADLDKYYKALDKALMKYHSVKMEEINKIIKEHWESTYQGSDIDTIEIRAEPEDKGVASSGVARRSFNYRVVMIKGQTDLDMRGRCSAGQKVLASLIIRLALAEAFCINCGVLALDEPTTNLDIANVQSLARALSVIIESRRKQKNFQLIVITHDEQFVSQLGRANSDYYYKVSKELNGSSIITRHDIRDLQDVGS